jgi:hypothetical protein
VGSLTDTSDMGHWTSQHLTAETINRNVCSVPARFVCLDNRNAADIFLAQGETT